MTENRIVILLGDRYEMLAAAQATHYWTSIAHIAGGDTTELLTKIVIALTKWHIICDQQLSARRVRQLGKNPNTFLEVRH